MSKFAARQAVAFFLGGAFFAAPALAAPWYVGKFRGHGSDAAAEPRMSVVCRSGERCAVLAARAGSQPKPVEIPIRAEPRPIDPEIPNNNWAITRNAAASRPEWSANPSFGPLLAPLRPALQSGARFAGCVDLDGTAYLALCSLSTDPEATRTVMLLVSTMNATCGSLPFCAYYFVPLERVSGE